MIDLVLLIAGLVCLALAAAGVASGRVAVGWLGLLLIFAREIVG